MSLSFSFCVGSMTFGQVEVELVWLTLLRHNIAEECDQHIAGTKRCRGFGDDIRAIKHEHGVLARRANLAAAIERNFVDFVDWMLNEVPHPSKMYLIVGVE